MSKLETPNLLTLINRIAGGDESEVQQFFNIKRKPGKQWLDSIAPGVDAAQRALSAHLAEINGELPEQKEKDERLVATIKGIFGPGAEDFLYLLEKRLLDGKRVNLLFDRIEEGKVKLVVSDPDDAPAPPVEDIVEPKGGFFAEETASTVVEELVNRLRPQLLLSRDGPQDVEAVLRAVLSGKWSRRVSMLLPVNRDINPHVVFGLLAQVRKQPWLGVHYHADTVIQHARNILAKKFLDSEAEWSFWLDSDIIAPFGDAAFFFDHRKLGADPAFFKPEFAGLMAVERLMKAQKTLVGGVYQMRQAGNDIPMVIQPNLHPSGPKDRELVASLNRGGPRDEVVPVGYVATGCALVHRSVYRDIMTKFPELQPEEKGEPFDFFGHDVGKGGEDIHFCNLAAQAGHSSFLDLGCWAAHIGNYAFFPRKSVK